MRRRTLLAGAAAAAFVPRRGRAETPRRIVALEWSIVSMLLSLGVAPVGMPEIGAYRDWVVEPPVPRGVADIGIKTEPNFEAMAALRPDLILSSPLNRAIAPLLVRIAPVQEVTIYGDRGDPLRAAAEELSGLGTLLGRSEAAEAVIAGSEAAFRDAREQLAGRADRPVLLVSFVDAEHLRIFGPESLFSGVAVRAGLANAWTEPTNAWGFVLKGMAELARLPEVRILVIEPTPAGVIDQVRAEALWAHLPAVRAGRVATVPAAWPYGDLVAAARFARLLPPALAGMAA